MAERKKRGRAIFRLTRSGAFFCVVTIGVGLGAVNTGNNLLFLVLGLMLSLLLLSGVLSEAAIWGFRARRILPQRVFAGEPSPFAFEVRSRSRLFPTRSVTLIDPAAEKGGRAYLSKLEVGGVTPVPYAMTLSHRGPVTLPPIRAETRYPFGLIEKYRRIKDPAEVIVFPARDGDASRAKVLDTRGHDRPMQGEGRGVEIVGVRPMRDNDLARSIHWQRSATLGTTVVRERGREQAEEVELGLMRRVADAGYEEEIRDVTASALDQIAHGRWVRVKADADTSPFAHGGAAEGLLAWLALRPVAEDEAP